MAADTGKFGIIVRIGVTIDAVTPFGFVAAGVDWKVLIIMIYKFCWLPSELSCMTHYTIVAESTGLMIGIDGLVKVHLMTTGTIRAGIRKIIRGMTGFAILYVVT